jgi:glycosyltransferase involved in cell wall biosynthesis
MKGIRQLAEHLEKKVELAIAGNVPESMRKLISKDNSAILNWLGLVPHEQIRDLDKNAHLLFTAEINAACPNSVVEALACGLPVAGYATGSIPELVGEDAGVVMPYGSDYWKLEAPVSDGLVQAALNVLKHLPQYQKSARKRAEDLFGLDHMVEAYQKILLSD